MDFDTTFSTFLPEKFSPFGMNRIKHTTNTEIWRFGLYLLFPVATLFLFNRPEVLKAVPCETLEKIDEDFKTIKSRLYRIPKSKSEIEECLERIRK